MARERIQDVETLKYDKCLVTVNRKQKMNDKGVMQGYTESVTIREILRTNMPATEISINALNMAIDFENASEEGKPNIIQYFPAGMVAEAHRYAASDVMKEEGDIFKKRLVIDLTQKLN
jgi:hypothetical protein